MSYLLWWVAGWLPVVKFRHTWRASEANRTAMRSLAEKALEILEQQGEDGLDRSRGYLYAITMLEAKF